MRLAGCLLCGLLLFSLHCQAEMKRDTVFTSDGDRIILLYEKTVSENHTIIKFTGQQKKLGRLNARKYKDLSKVAVMFFDRTGNYDKDLSITNMVPEAFMTPYGVEYEKSADGFFLVQSEPRLIFKVKSGTNIKIPIYLAYKPKKGKYILFSKSKDLTIPLTVKTPHKSNNIKMTAQTVQQTITSTTEIEADNTDVIKVLESINLAKNLIAETEELPFSDNLIDEINYLRQKRRELTDKDILSEISDVLDKYEEKKKFLEDKSETEQMSKQREEEQRAKEEAQSIKAQNDSIAAAQQQAAEKEKKRNFWMIIGGIVLAILAFIGNQLLQGFRNKRNQMRMMDMQQNIADRAEAEAKRRARNAIRSQQNRIINDAKKKASDVVKKRNTSNIKGKSKNVSI